MKIINLIALLLFITNVFAMDIDHPVKRKIPLNLMKNVNFEYLPPLNDLKELEKLDLSEEAEQDVKKLHKEADRYFDLHRDTHDEVEKEIYQYLYISNLWEACRRGSRYAADFLYYAFYGDEEMENMLRLRIVRDLTIKQERNMDPGFDLLREIKAQLKAKNPHSPEVKLIEEKKFLDDSFVTHSGITESDENFPFLTKKNK